MPEQNNRMTMALETALEMEVEGKKFYQKAGQKSISTLAQEVFKHLAAEEDVHFKKVTQVYRELAAGKGWPAKESALEHKKHMKIIERVVKDAMDRMDISFQAPASEIEALKVGMSMEDKSYSLYRNLEKESESPAERAFFKALTGEERVHYLALQSSHEFLLNPQGWFTMKEHWSLDGM